MHSPLRAKSKQFFDAAHREYFEVPYTMRSPPLISTITTLITQKLMHAKAHAPTPHEYFINASFHARWCA
jgi:hypothetical protein